MFLYLYLLLRNKLAFVNLMSGFFLIYTRTTENGWFIRCIDFIIIFDKVLFFFYMILTSKYALQNLRQQCNRYISI